MSLSPFVPPTPANTNSGIQNYKLATTLGVDNTARPGGAMPPQISGENIDETPILPADGNKVEETYKEETKGEVEQEYFEPSMPYGGSVNSSIWNTRFGGAYIEVSGKKGTAEFINIVHTSGTHITLDANGSILIKSFGDTHNITKGNLYETTAGEKVQVNNGGYTIHVKDGTLDIRSEGNLNISSGADMNISAAGKLTMNIGDAMDLAAARIAMLSRVDTTDIVSNGIMRIHSLADMNIKCNGGTIFVETDGETNIKSEGTINVESDSNFNCKGINMFLEGSGSINSKSGSSTFIESGSVLNLRASSTARMSGSNAHIRGSTVFIDNIVRMAQGGATNAASASSARSAAPAADGIKAGVPDELEKSVFAENKVSKSSGSTGSAIVDDDQGE